MADPITSKNCPADEYVTGSVTPLDAAGNAASVTGSAWSAVTDSTGAPTTDVTVDTSLYAPLADGSQPLSADFLPSGPSVVGTYKATWTGTGADSSGASLTLTQEFDVVFVGLIADHENPGFSDPKPLSSRMAGIPVPPATPAP